MPGLTIRRTPDECIFLGEALDLNNPRDTFDHKIRVQKVKGNEVELEIFTREKNKIDCQWQDVEKGTELIVGKTLIRCKDTYREKVRGNMKEVVDLEFEAPKEVLIHRDDLI